jgi:hypothetical protein
MNNVAYLTLAAVRESNIEAFDNLIKCAVFAAASDVGVETLIDALCSISASYKKEHLIQAA